MRSKYELIAERLKPFGFERISLHEDAVVVSRYAMDGHLRQGVQLVEHSATNTKVSLTVGYDVLDRIGDDDPRKAQTLSVDVRRVNRLGDVDILDSRRMDEYLGWECDEVEAIADVAVKYGVPWLDSWADPHKIIQFILDDIVAREAAVAKWNAEAAKEITFWQRLRGQRKPDPFYRPRGSPPIYQNILANLYLYIGNKQEAVKYLANVCAAHPRWKVHHDKLEELRKPLGQQAG